MARFVLFIPCCGIIAIVALASAGCQSETTSPSPAPAIAANKGDVSRNTELARQLTRQANERIAAEDDERAQALLRQAIAADPLYGAARNELGLIDYHQGKLWEAAWEFQNAAKLMPERAEPLNNLGLTLERGGKLADAEQEYAQAFALDPANAIYAGNQARARVRLDQMDEKTRQLLQFVLFHDTRQSWVDWALATLPRIPAATPAPTTGDAPDAR